MRRIRRQPHHFLAASQLTTLPIPLSVPRQWLPASVSRAVRLSLSPFPGVGLARGSVVCWVTSCADQTPLPTIDLSQFPDSLLLFLGPGRCYPFWQEVLGCYAVNSGEGEAGKKQCTPALEDYYECLHHRKEVRCCPRSDADLSGFEYRVIGGNI
jgi:hypothetical protein